MANNLKKSTMTELQCELFSNSQSKIPISFNEIVAALETGFLGKNFPLIPVSNIEERLIEFQNFLSTISPLSLLHLKTSDIENILFLLLNLKNSFEAILTKMDKTKKQAYTFTCGQCNENIFVNPNINIWSSLQLHSHFEEACANKKFNTVLQHTTNILKSTSKSNNFDILNDSNTDSRIEQVENDILDRQKTTKQAKESNFQLNNYHKEVNLKEDVNNFRFNFPLHYDTVIEDKLYPESFMNAVKKYDKIVDYTILRAGHYRAVCLLCSCDLLSRGAKISKSFILDHVMGQRHIKFTSNPINVEAVKWFHETWLNFDVIYQAHQVYFRPEIGKNFKCVLCNMLVLDRKLREHIQADPHKRNVIELFDRNDKPYFLTEIQIQLYGPECQAKAHNRIKEIEERKIQNEDRKQKAESESSPSPKSKEPIHSIIKSVENPNSNKILDSVPNRMRGHIKYFKLYENHICCELCNKSLPQQLEYITSHISQSAHIKASDVDIKKYHYYCEICNTKYTDEISWQKHFFVERPAKHIKIPNVRKEKVTEYECTKCFTVIFGDEISLLRHLATKKEKKSKEVKLSENVKKIFRTKEFIETEGKRLTEESSKTLHYNELTSICCNMLEKALIPFFPNCKAYPFGSRISGLGNKFSDLDVFLDVDDMYDGNKNQDSMSQVQLVRKVAQVLFKHQDEFREVCQIPTARTPIVKFHHILTNIDCDVSFRHGLSVENTKFLRFCIDVQPITQPFILLLKKWSEHNKLTEHITTYALAIMGIFYLQIHYHLLSVKEIRQLNPGKPLIINGWETITYVQPLEEMKKQIQPFSQSLHELLRDFFAYFAKFQYNVDVVCPLLGKIIKKDDFLDNGKHLPPEMRSYVEHLNCDEPDPFRSMSAFCIQDPFDLSHNLTKALQPGTLNRFKTLCDLSVKFLDSIN